LAARRDGRQPGDPTRWDRLPLWLPLLAGIAAGAALGWLALRGGGGGVLPLGLVVLALLVWQGARPRLVITGLPRTRSRALDEAAQAPATTGSVAVKQPGAAGSALISGPSGPSGPSGLRPVRVPGMEMVPLSGGPFMMGSDPAIDKMADGDEQPRHEVLLSPFEIADRPVTRGLYRRVMGEGPRAWGDDPRRDLPATDLSWSDAARFCNRLSAEQGLSECYLEEHGEWR